VPFFSGKFDDPKYDIIKDPTAHSGITCTVCHAMTHINSSIGNGAYTIDTPPHYPFAYSDNEVLQWINNQLVRAKPDFHKKTFLKPFHKTAEFCSTCHKVSLPKFLNHYKEWNRGQNHYDTYLLSGVSGVGARSFYYPPKAKTNCAECHMPLKESGDFGSKVRDDSGKRKIHDHNFPAANTGLFTLLSRDAGRYGKHSEQFKRAAQLHADFLRGTDPKGTDKKVRIDLFALKEGGTIDDRPIHQIRPKLPILVPGKTYLIEVVIRTLNLGHPFPQGTADSNEIWVEFIARAGKRILGRSGAMNGKKPDTGPVNPKSHFVNMLVLDRNGKRIDRRNPQDIYTPLYDHQIPPGAGQVVHYRLTVPEDVKDAVELSVRLRYRKFDYQYMSLVYGKGSKAPPLKDGAGKVPTLPIIDMCSDRVLLPVRGVAQKVSPQLSSIKPAWQRWNDYGIGCYLEGTPGGNKIEGQKQEGNQAQAERAFTHLIEAPEFSGDPVARGNGYINRARVYNDMGKLREAVRDLRAVNALNKENPDNPPVPWWTVAWITGLVDQRQERWDLAIAQFEKILDPDNQPFERKFDFTHDYVVINKLGAVLFERGQDQSLSEAARAKYLRRAIGRFEKTLQIDPENLDAHIGLKRCYNRLGLQAPWVEVPAESAPREREEPIAVAEILANNEADRDERLRAARRLELGVRELGRQPTQPDKPKGKLLRALREKCRQVYLKEEDEGLQAAAARVLGMIHIRFQAIYKPDENAKEARKKYFEEHEALREVYEPPVAIYPLY
jgi:tetratricopeptide (TPR) repeat protein